MKDSIIILMLQLIKFNGSIENIVNKGYSYSQVSYFLQEILSKEWIEYKDDRLQLTLEGREKLDLMNRELDRRSSAKWISPQTEYMIEGLTKYDIYLP